MLAVYSSPEKMVFLQGNYVILVYLSKKKIATGLLHDDSLEGFCKVSCWCVGGYSASARVMDSSEVLWSGLTRISITKRRPRWSVNSALRVTQ